LLAENRGRRDAFVISAAFRAARRFGLEARSPGQGSSGADAARLTPIRQIVENAGVEGSIVVGKILENKSQTFGFDAQSETYVDLIEAGIIDPAKVVRAALQDAASVASLIVTTEALVAELPKKDNPAFAPQAAAAISDASPTRAALSRQIGFPEPVCRMRWRRMNAGVTKLGRLQHNYPARSGVLWATASLPHRQTAFAVWAIFRFRNGLIAVARH
jgi:hypothetical protein